MIAKIGMMALMVTLAMTGAAHASPKIGTAVQGMQPSRLLDCQLGQISNYDSTKDQQPRDFIYKGWHSIKLFLPSIPLRTKEPPRSTQAPEPVDPRTKIVADPDDISSGAAKRPFDRVVDYWPERVEMTTPIDRGGVNLIVIEQSKSADGLVDMFLTRATDAISYDPAHIYSGRCKLMTGPDAEIAVR